MMRPDPKGAGALRPGNNLCEKVDMRDVCAVIIALVSRTRHNPRGVVAVHPEPRLMTCRRGNIHHHLTFRVEIINLLTSTRERNSPPLLSEGGDHTRTTVERMHDHFQEGRATHHHPR